MLQKSTWCYIVVPILILNSVVANEPDTAEQTQAAKPPNGAPSKYVIAAMTFVGVLALLTLLGCVLNRGLKIYKLKKEERQRDSMDWQDNRNIFVY